jgi:CubicO group peptidase (beta-lactamase class C family)
MLRLLLRRLAGRGHHRGTLLLCLASSLTIGAAPVAGQGSTDIAASSRQLDALFERWRGTDSPGASVLVMRDGEVVHARGYGMANLEHGVPNGTTTVFDIASVSKQFAAMAILMLAERGTIGLDDDVRDHIPELPDFGAPIRIRHLVHHTSGLRDWPGTLRIAGWDYMDVLSFEQILTMVRHQRDLNFPPGLEYAYSNTGYNLLAEVVTRATGTSFADWTRHNIFEPLGMRSTHFHDDHTAIVPNRAESYVPRPGGGFRRVVSSLTALGSSSLFTTVEDLSLWIRNFDEAALGSPELLARLEERGSLSDGSQIRYAFGVNVDVEDGRRTVSHTGSWGGYRSILIRYPDQGLSIGILANSSDINTTEIARRIAAVYLGTGALASRSVSAASATPPAAAAEVAVASVYWPAAEQLQEFEGEYHSSELLTSYRLRVQDGRLVAEHFRVEPRVLQPLAPDLFVASVFGQVHFLRGPDGRIEGFTASSERSRGIRFERIR